MSLRTNPDAPRILHIITRLDSGGAATNTLASVEGLRQHGFKTCVVYGRTQDPDGSITAHLRDHDMPNTYVPQMVRDVAPALDIVALRTIRRILVTSNCDLVHTHCSKAGALGRLAARTCGLPAVHTPHGHVFYGYFGPLPTRLFVTAERYLARSTRRLVSLTDDETREAVRHGIGRREQYRTIPSGVPLRWFAAPLPGEAEIFRRAHAIPRDATLIVSSGRLVPIKGFDLLIRAFAQRPARRDGTYLAILGDGPERGALAQLAQREGVGDRVRFAGHVADVRPALRAADVFALASRNEGMGRSLIEALAGGCAVVATDAGGIPTFLVHRSNGLLVPREDVHALAEALELLTRQPALRAELAHNAPKSIGPEFDQATMVEQLAGLYHDVLRST